GAKHRRSAQLTRRPAQKRHLFVSSACQSADTAHRLLKFGGRPHAKADETASRGEHARDDRSILLQGLADLLDFFSVFGILSFDGVQRFTASLPESSERPLQTVNGSTKLPAFSRRCRQTRRGVRTCLRRRRAQLRGGEGGRAHAGSHGSPRRLDVRAQLQRIITSAEDVGLEGVGGFVGLNERVTVNLKAYSDDKLSQSHDRHPPFLATFG